MAKHTQNVVPAYLQGEPVMGLESGTTLRIIKVNSDGSIVGAVLPEPASSLLDGTKAVAAAGVAEALASTTIVRAVLVQALRTNTGYVYVGNNATQNITLAAGEGETIWIDDLAKIYLDVDVNGEGVAYHAMP